MSRSQSQRMSAGVHPGEIATSKILSFWHQCAVPAASSANPPACPRCSSTTIPACHLWLSWWSWMTVPMPTSVEKILLLWKIYQTSPDCEEHFVCCCLFLFCFFSKKKKPNGHFISLFKMILLIWMYHRKNLSVLSVFFLQGRLNLFCYSFPFWMCIYFPLTLILILSWHVLPIALQ